MRKVFCLVTLWAINIVISFAQHNISIENDIENDAYVSPNYPTSPSDHCFGVEYFQDNCIPVYVNVNVHFFLKDNCEGNLAKILGLPGNLSPNNAFQLAEDFVNNSNAFFEKMSEDNQALNYQWNTAANGATATSSQCIPIRYVLKGIRIHCKSSNQNIGGFFQLGDYFINSGSEINVFIGNVPGGANGFSRLNFNGMVSENFDPAVFNHEIGHALNLEHTFNNSGDGCADTWDYDWTWDGDCNPNTTNINGTNCWDSNVNYNGQNACDTLLFYSKHPCCEWTAQNNNLMAYSSWAGNPDYSALTPCQINRMLTNLAEYKCDFIKVGGCPPPSAFIGTLPSPPTSTKCQTCFHLNASFNESGYEMDILRPNGTKIISTGEVFTEAGKFCISPRYDKYGNPYWPNGFQSGVEYKMIFKVFNECGDEDEIELKFTLPAICQQVIIDPVPDTPKFVVEGISPNPSTSFITIKYSPKENGQLKVFGSNLNTLNQYGFIRNSAETVGDNQQFTLDITNWQKGIDSLIFEFNGKLNVETVTKN